MPPPTPCALADTANRESRPAELRTTDAEATAAYSLLEASSAEQSPWRLHTPGFRGDCHPQSRARVALERARRMPSKPSNARLGRLVTGWPLHRSRAAERCVGRMTTIRWAARLRCWEVGSRRLLHLVPFGCVAAPPHGGATGNRGRAQPHVSEHTDGSFQPARRMSARRASGSLPSEPRPGGWPLWEPVPVPLAVAGRSAAACSLRR